VVADILAALDLAAANWLDRAGRPATKDALKAEVARAIGLGIFGAPTFIAAGELFWGHDRLDDALDWAARPETRVP
jgi:2-hydroxychromene-2-carboxylate isomerase